MTDDTVEKPQRLNAWIEAPNLDAGLYMVATPIGTARDITLRALDVLNAADLLVAEDTRVLRHLMNIHGVPLRSRRIIAYHDHNADRQIEMILAALTAGKSVAYTSDAGTPLIADPGFRLGRDAAASGAQVLAVPGASAALAALTVSGLPSDRFMFAGFPPAAKGARTTWLAQTLAVDATAILFESPRRVKQTLEIICQTDPSRRVVICRELTKKFEEIIRGTVTEVLALVPDAGLKGEVVLVVDRPVAPDVGDDAVRQALVARLDRMSLKDAAREVAAMLGLAKRDVYQIGLALDDNDGTGGT